MSPPLASVVTACSLSLFLLSQHSATTTTGAAAAAAGGIVAVGESAVVAAAAAATAGIRTDTDTSPPALDSSPPSLESTPAELPYDPAAALSAVYLTKATSCSAETLTTWSCGLACEQNPAMTSVQVFATTYDMQSFTGYNAATDQVVVSFRGSSNIQNWIEDIKAIKVDYPLCAGCQVHDGFHETYKDAAASLMPAVWHLLNAHPNSKLLVAGHSLGAALARLSALDLKTTFPFVDVTLYTFGEPRVGNLEFAKWASATLSSSQQSSAQQHVRVTHSDDPVPHLPMQLEGFQHVPHEVWYRGKGSTTGYTQCRDAPTHEDADCSNSETPMLWLDINAHLTYLDVETYNCD